MVANANLTPPSLSTSYLPTPPQEVTSQPDEKLLYKVDEVAVAGTIISYVLAAVYQPILFATLPAVFLCLSNLKNRHQLTELAQQNKATLEIVDRVSQEAEANRTALAEQSKFAQEAIAQAKKDLLPRQALAAINSKLQKVEKQRIVIQTSWLPQLTQCQDTIVELQNQITTLEYQLKKSHSAGKTALRSPATSSPLPKGERGRVAIFIDGSNLYHALLEKDWEIDYEKLLNVLTQNGEIVAAYFYTGIERNQPNQQRFLSYLRYLGYEIVAKDVVQFSDGSKKANLDVELALDMVRLAQSYDTAVLVSGDGDFSYAVKQAKQKQVRIEVASFPSVTSHVLIEAGDLFLNLDTLQHKIRR